MKYNYSIIGSNGSEVEEATYEGQWKAGKREGQGKLTWGDESSFTGIWKNDMRFEGEMRNSNGIMYIGKFENDKPQG